MLDNNETEIEFGEASSEVSSVVEINPRKQKGSLSHTKQKRSRLINNSPYEGCKKGRGQRAKRRRRE